MKKLRAAFGMLVTDVEIIYVFVVPIIIFRWPVGLLVSSGLTSLMHIVQLLRKIGARLGIKDI